MEHVTTRGRTRENIARGIRISWDASPGAFVGIAVLSVLTSLMPPVLVWLGKHLIDLIVESLRTPLTFRDLLPTVIAIALVSGLSRALTAVQGTEHELFAYQVSHRAQSRFLERSASVDLGHFDNSDWHDRMARAKRDIGWRPFQLAYTTLGLGGNFVGMAGMLGLLATLHPILVALSLLSLVPLLTVQRRVNRRIYEWHFHITTDDREEEYVGELLSDPDTAKEIRAFGLVDHLLGRHADIHSRKYRALSRLYRRWEIVSVATGLVGGVIMATAYGFVAWRGLAGELTPGDLAAVVAAFTAVASQAGLVSSSLLQLDQHATFLDDYFSFLAIERLLPVSDSAEPLPVDLTTGLAFRDVRFSYPRATEEALSGIDLRVEPGQLIALVGENGAGKSTIVNLLLRFYDPTSGTVSLEGTDLRETDEADLRSRFGVLFQDFAKLQLSLRENVALGRVGSAATDDDIHAALESARANFLLKSLTDGLDSKVGRLFEGGHELSGGEWQRLALARLMFRQADIWILDEPTSNLDPAAEAAIFTELKEQLHGRMGIVISHRFSTVRVCDRIYVVEEGRVRESGSHDELIALGGRYAELFELQAAGYR